MDEEPSPKPAKGYSKRSKAYWAVVYLVVAAIVYGFVYLLFIYKSGGDFAGGFNF